MDCTYIVDLHSIRCTMYVRLWLGSWPDFSVVSTSSGPFLVSSWNWQPVVSRISLNFDSGVSQLIHGWFRMTRMDTNLTQDEDQKWVGRKMSHFPGGAWTSLSAIQILFFFPGASLKLSRVRVDPSISETILLSFCLSFLFQMRYSRWSFTSYNFNSYIWLISICPSILGLLDSAHVQVWACPFIPV